MKKSWYYPILVFFIIMGSFFLYSSNFFAGLNSDDAITILMIRFFSLPRDIYFWGQDRYGSLIPLLGQIPYKVFGIPPITSESITHYVILIAGYLAFSSLLKSKINRIILAIVWFFPANRQIDLLRFNIGVGYSLIAIAIYLLNHHTSAMPDQNKFLQHLRLVAVVLLLIISVWVSDLSVITIALLLSVRGYFIFRTRTGDKFHLMSILRTPGILYTLVGIATGILVLLWAKSTGDPAKSYSSISAIETIITSAGIFIRTLLDIMLFRFNDPLTGVWSWLTVILIPVFVLTKPRFEENSRLWFLFFLFDGILIFFTILVSEWAFLNGVARRYFVGSYISLAMVFLLAMDRVPSLKYKKLLQTVVLITVLIGAGSTIYNLKYFFPKTFKPRAEIVKEFRSLGKSGIIADYWNSYLISAVSPDHIVATANDRSTVRNKEFVRAIFLHKNIYVIRDGWLTTFPDTLTQFGRVLIKDGDEFRMGHCDVCRYKQ